MMDAGDRLPTATMSRHVEMGDLDSVRLYFVSGFRWMASAFEGLLRGLGHPLEGILAEGHLTPLVHAECDYSRSPALGDAFDVVTRVERIGSTSVSITHAFIDERGEFARGRTVHVWIDASTTRPAPVPAWLRGISRSY